ncbi:thioesterase family protein [Brachyspira murdochii]|uniref:Thioesterase superfamily protein n=2 Tax=Brachyspira murdochii TaxID=84378 RepID=D5U8A9_BRAM5|nr:thioesterase family protein [Brachyspira murdochii]ADG70932.1 thioesterase superfamily protein [Brachyspira murdochii DSM 12563]PPS22220.1 thioesterase [Brachyspira murdochii]
MAHVNKTEIRVIYADTDQMGVVYHSNYLRYFEIGRTELLRELGISYKDMEEKYNVMLPVKEAFVDYKISIKYDDVIVVHTSVDKLRNASLKLKYEIRSKENDILYSTGYTLHPFVNKKSGDIVKPDDYLYEIMSKGK